MTTTDYLPAWHAEKAIGAKISKGGSLKIKLLVLCGVLLVLLVTIGSLLYVRNILYEEKLKAIGDTTPYAVKFTNVSNESFTIEWQTKSPTIGFIKYGMTARSLDLIGQSEINSAESKTEHSVVVDGLDSGQKYYIEIHSNALAYGEAGEPLSVKTLE